MCRDRRVRRVPGAGPAHRGAAGLRRNRGTGVRGVRPAVRVPHAVRVPRAAPPRRRPRVVRRQLHLRPGPGSCRGADFWRARGPRAAVARADRRAAAGYRVPRAPEAGRPAADSAGREAAAGSAATNRRPGVVEGAVRRVAPGVGRAGGDAGTLGAGDGAGRGAVRRRGADPGAAGGAGAGPGAR